MEPIGIEADQCAHLPEHEFGVYAKDQPQYRPLPVVKLAGREGRVISRWTLTDDERAAIARGEDFYVEQLTFNNPLQPILPTVGLRKAWDEDFRKSFQAHDWARAFVERVKANPSIATDEGAMIGWFANALMRGFDESSRCSRHEAAKDADSKEHTHAS